MRRLLVLLLFVSCTQKSQEPATIIWENNKAVAVSLDRVPDSLLIFVKGSAYPVLGETSDNRFTPVVPFERGQTYEVFSGSKSITTFAIPADTTLTTPVVRGSFPSCDTVPSNLLKIYLTFSEPMMEGRSAQYIQLYDNTTGDTVKNAFLDLQPELWNEDRTVLTLWLDPGRIKQDLIPNKKLGVVLNDNHSYRLEVAKGWRSKNGVATSNEYSRTFVTTSRDTQKPDVSKWSIHHRNDTIIVDTKETLDWSLLNNTLSIWSGDREIQSKTISERCERGVLMITGTSLKRGTYTLKVEARLEDPAGNNLNRLFETDVTSKSDNNNDNEVYTRTFIVN